MPTCTSVLSQTASLVALVLFQLLRRGHRTGPMILTSLVVANFVQHSGCRPQDGVEDGPQDGVEDKAQDGPQDGPQDGSQDGPQGTAADRLRSDLLALLRGEHAPLAGAIAAGAGLSWLGCRSGVDVFRLSRDCSGSCARDAAANAASMAMLSALLAVGLGAYERERGAAVAGGLGRAGLVVGGSFGLISAGLLSRDGLSGDGLLGTACAPRPATAFDGLRGP